MKLLSRYKRIQTWIAITKCYLQSNEAIVYKILEIEVNDNRIGRKVCQFLSVVKSLQKPSTKKRK